MHATFTVFWLNIAFIAVHSGERCGPWASGLPKSQLQVRFINLIPMLFFKRHYIPLVYSIINYKVTNAKKPYSERQNISTDITKAVRYACYIMNSERKENYGVPNLP